MLRAVSDALQWSARTAGDNTLTGRGVPATRLSKKFNPDRPIVIGRPRRWIGDLDREARRTRMGILPLNLPRLPTLMAMSNEEPRLRAVSDKSAFELAARIIAVEPKYARQIVTLRNHELSQVRVAT